MTAIMPEEAKHAVDKCRCLRSSELFAGARVLTILHGQDEYRLQITATGKLILTK